MTSDQVLFQVICIGVSLSIAAVFIRERWKTGDMPFRTYWFVYGLGLWFFGCFMYGIVFFIDAPIHESTAAKPCIKSVFCGKSGIPHTREDYQAFLRWQTILFFSALVTLPPWFVAMRIARRAKDASSK